MIKLTTKQVNQIHWWILCGVYLGYSTESIFEFCSRSLHLSGICLGDQTYVDGLNEKMRVFEESPFNMTGHIPSRQELNENPTDVVTQINQRRICDTPFSLSPCSESLQESNQDILSIMQAKGLLEEVREKLVEYLLTINATYSEN